jgi:hypothetical protein
MKYSGKYIDVEIDKLTNSIENAITKDCFNNMGLIKEPLDIDFFVDPKPLTKDEIGLISEYIKADKEKRSKAKPNKKKNNLSTHST